MKTPHGEPKHRTRLGKLKPRCPCSPLWGQGFGSGHRCHHAPVPAPAPPRRVQGGMIQLLVLQRIKKVNYPPALLLTKQPGKDKEEIKRLQKEVICRRRKGGSSRRSSARPLLIGTHGKGTQAGEGRPAPLDALCPGLRTNTRKQNPARAFPELL